VVGEHVAGSDPREGVAHINGIGHGRSFGAAGPRIKRQASLAGASHFLQQHRIRLQRVRHGTDDVERGPGNVVLHAFHVAVNGFLVDAEKPQETG